MVAVFEHCLCVSRPRICVSFITTVLDIYVPHMNEVMKVDGPDYDIVSFVWSSPFQMSENKTKRKIPGILGQWGIVGL